MTAIFQRANQYLFFAILTVIILYFGKTILVPVAFAALFAMLMAPLCRRLDRKLRRGLSTLICILIILFTILGMLAIVGGQIASFSKQAPKIKEKAKQGIEQVQQFVQQKFGVAPKKQEQIAKEQAKSTSGKKGGGFVTKFLSGLTTTIGTFVLSLVYAFLMLYNKEQFENFFLKLANEEKRDKVKKVVGKIATVSQKYLTGRLISVTIIACLYAIGLSIVGIKNAILLAGIAAMLTVIPYFGTVLGGLIPVVMALVTEDSMQPALYAAVVLFVIQTMDNYFIEPNVVGGEVNVNALTSIFSIIAGGLIWGIAGMIIFLPLAGIVKIICDNIDPLQPIGYLMGEAGGKKPSKIKLWIQKKLGKDKRESHA
ncbi:MAG TPA: AI-2E family transporter [Chryseosolibacter sp.]|nr:AI-2E family transporter [Chryseosolibacter sp.]